MAGAATIADLLAWLRDQDAVRLDSRQAARAAVPADSGLSIVIPSYNAIGVADTLLRQLAGLPQVVSGQYEVIVTDDASSDGTVERYRRLYPGFRFIVSPENTGFGRNANRGLEAAQRGYTALVNTDVELAGNPFPQLIEKLAGGAELFALMPLIYNTARRQVENLQTLIYSRGLVWNTDLPAAAAFTDRLRPGVEAGQPAASLLQGLPAAGVIGTILCGACFVARTAELQQLGGFDPQFSPFYWEDVDLGFAGAFHLLGRYAPDAVGVLPDTLVLHRHSESIDKRHGKRKLQFLRLNQLRFVQKWLNRLGAFSAQEARRWYLLRALREIAGGDPALRSAYFHAATGKIV